MTSEAPVCVSDLFCGNQPLSFEIFPPKGDLTETEARRVAGELVQMHPAFISVTYSAGGSGNSGATTKVASLIQRELGVPSVAHLTCQGLTRAMLDEKIAEMRAAGIQNVLALRGDPRPDAPLGDFSYAADIIGILREAGFCVGAAAYPEGHITCESLEADVAHLREKQDAGAQFFVTQLFFDNEDFFHFRDMAEHAGITAPITCGIMPFMSKSQVSRMIFMCGASLPSPIIRLLNRYDGDDEALRRAGIEYAAAQLRGLRDEGARGLHVYTMNKPAVARAICELL